MHSGHAGQPHYAESSPYLAHSLIPAATPTSLPYASQHAPELHARYEQVQQPRQASQQQYQGAVWLAELPPAPAPQPQNPYPQTELYGADELLREHCQRRYSSSQALPQPQTYLVPASPSQPSRLVVPDSFFPDSAHQKRRRLSLQLNNCGSAGPGPLSDLGTSTWAEYPARPPQQPLVFEYETSMLPPVSGTAMRRASNAGSAAERRGSVVSASGSAGPSASPSLATARPPHLQHPAAASASPVGFTPPLVIARPAPVAGEAGSASESKALQKGSASKAKSRDGKDEAGKAEKIRKVRCSRTWPTCARCKEKKLECHYGNFVPIDLVKSLHPESRVAELEARIKSLEIELASSAISPAHSTFSAIPNGDLGPTAYSHIPSPAELPVTIYNTLLSALGDTLTPSRLEAHTDAVLASAQRRAARYLGLDSPKLAATIAPLSSAGAQHIASVHSDVALIAHKLSLLAPHERTQHSSWPRLVVWALLDDFWASCQSNIPTMLAFHNSERKARLYTDLDRLPPAERCVLVAFCAAAARSTADVALLGMDGVEVPSPSPSSEAEIEQPRQRSLAVQREHVARALRTLMMELYDRLEIAHGEGDEVALQATLVCGAIMMWNELLPRRSRSLVRDALGHYRNLFDATAALPTPEAVADRRKQLMTMYALPLLHQDSTTAAYLRTSPLISAGDLSAYFPAFPIPTLAVEGQRGASDGKEWNLRDEMLPWYDLERLGSANHEQLLMGSMMIYKWLAACLRWCAEMAAVKASTTPLSAHAITTLFSLLSQIHAAIQTLQHHFVYTPAPVHPSCVGPNGDTCEHVHLRWATRLDRETDDCCWIAYATVAERMMREDQQGSTGGMEGAEMQKDDDERAVADGDRLDVGWLQMSEGKVRQGLKLAAFYFNFFTISPDPHQTHHLAWSLELIPSWTFLATQRYTPLQPVASPSTPLNLAGSIHTPAGTATGPRKKADELTETELDWIERGLEEAQKYHPVAEKRLVELRAFRDSERTRVQRLVNSGAMAPLPPAFSRPSPAATKVVVPSTPWHRLPDKPWLSFQAAMMQALAQTVPSWA
ncbi:hypothetical protein Rhopal_001262-T1 [Rhodotorula paludigena]|uniref:Zn(2)-C6 fungal-type domain-containing protein n=1 Tax=Rhodotorula paludigena TaxID=86838 RepID=A0AAV5GGX2_9BASI|nr:hypothetical protein Rhopal_001262-T1 [Rhodotorula paludigena]